MKEMVGGCCVCSDERGWDENPLVYCDGHGCNVAVHQGKFCFGFAKNVHGSLFMVFRLSTLKVTEQVVLPITKMFYWQTDNTNSIQDSLTELFPTWAS